MVNVVKAIKSRLTARRQASQVGYADLVSRAAKGELTEDEESRLYDATVELAISPDELQLDIDAVEIVRSAKARIVSDAEIAKLSQQLEAAHAKCKQVRADAEAAIKAADAAFDELDRRRARMHDTNRLARETIISTEAAHPRIFAAPVTQVVSPSGRHVARTGRLGVQGPAEPSPA